MVAFKIIHLKSKTAKIVNLMMKKTLNRAIKIKRINKMNNKNNILILRKIKKLMSKIKIKVNLTRILCKKHSWVFIIEKKINKIKMKQTKMIKSKLIIIKINNNILIEIKIIKWTIIKTKTN